MDKWKSAQQNVSGQGGSGASWWSYVLIAVAVICVLYSLFYSKEHEAFKDKIESAEAFYNEAKALSLSMPLLSDSMVFIIADSLLVTIVDLNHDWVIFVKTQKGFEDYTSHVEKLNNKLDKLRLEYEVVKMFRGIEKMIRKYEMPPRQWYEKKEKTIAYYN